MLRRPLFALRALFCVVLPAAALSVSDSTAKSQDPSVSSPAVAAPSPAADSNAAPAKKVWTNENLNEARGNVSVVGDKRNQKYSVTPNKPGDPGTVAHVRQDLQKLQEQLDDVNKKLKLYKAFENGEPVSTNERDFDKGVSRTPVDQQIVKLKEKAVKLKRQIDELVDEARKKGVPPNQLP
jgi:hypothetical protein